MEGSSLGPEVIKTTFGTISGFPELYVLDSTDPAQVKAFENKVDLRNTFFIVSSKSDCGPCGHVRCMTRT